jgi:hypothetical protein
MLASNYPAICEVADAKKLILVAGHIKNNFVSNIVLFHAAM